MLLGKRHSMKIKVNGWFGQVHQRVDPALVIGRGREIGVSYGCIVRVVRTVDL